MLIRSQRDFSTGLLLAAIGVPSAVAAGQRWWAGGTSSGTAAVAFALAALLTLLGISLWFTSLTIETEGGEPIRVRGWPSALALAGAAAVYAAGVGPFGVTLAGTAAAALAARAGPRHAGRGTTVLAAAAIACVALSIGTSVAGPLPAGHAAR